MNRSATRIVALTALGALMVCTAAVTVSSRLFPEGYSPARATWPELPPPLGWSRYDAGWYAHIATQGYSYTPGVQSPVAFFPAYPLQLRGLGLLGLDTYLAGVLVTPITTLNYDVGVLLGLKGFAAAILGGCGSFPGAIAGGLTLGLLESLSAGYISSAYKDVVAFVVLLLVLFVRPKGLLGK